MKIIKSLLPNAGPLVAWFLLVLVVIAQLHAQEPSAQAAPCLAIFPVFGAILRGLFYGLDEDEGIRRTIPQETWNEGPYHAWVSQILDRHPARQDQNSDGSPYPSGYTIRMDGGRGAKPAR